MVKRSHRKAPHRMVSVTAPATATAPAAAPATAPATGVERLQQLVELYYSETHFKMGHPPPPKPIFRVE